MQIMYCDGCRIQITPEDLRLHLAAEIQNNWYCAKCRKQKFSQGQQSSPTPPGRKARNRSSSSSDRLKPIQQ